MATVRKKTTRRKGQQQAQIRQFVVLDALRSWGTPVVVGVAVILLWVSYNVELVDSTPAVTIGGGLALFVALYAGLRDYIDEETTPTTAALLGVFAVVWGAITFYPFYRSVNLPPPLSVAELRAKGPSVTVPLHGIPGSYRVIVTGHFLSEQAGSSQAAHYRLRAGHGSTTESMLEGDFSEEWHQQRLGRRGSVPVASVHTIKQHLIDSPAGEDLTLALDELGAGVGEAITVQVYEMAFPLAWFAALGVVIAAAALLVDAWRDTETSDGLMTTMTLSAVLSVVAFHFYASARPGFGDLIVNGLVGTVVGALVAAGLWRLTRTWLRSMLRPEG